MNIFLTGDLHCGKSTVIDRFLALSGMTPGGFRTSFGADRSEKDRGLYIFPAAQAPVTDQAHTAVRFTNDRPTAIPGVFDALGTEYLKMPGDIVIMDELGRFESRELLFQQAVMEALDSPRPVLGVLRTGREIPWLDRVKGRRDVTIVPVTPENRDLVPGELLKMFGISQKVE